MISTAVDSYLAVRNAAGFEMSNERTALRGYAKFAAERGDTHVRARTAVAWAALGRSALQRDRRLKMVIRMARFLVAEDPRNELPPDGVFGHHCERPLPYLFSDRDLRLLLAAASRLPTAVSVVPRTYGTLFSLLASTGMRISEALALRLEDLNGDVLLIRNTKFKKSRLVPLHPTAAAGMNRYLAARRRAGGADEHLFLNACGRGLRYCTVRKAFMRCLRASGLSRTKKPRPCIHGLRHLFAVRALESCPKSSSGVGRHLLALTTYLGHARVADTYWYLQATPKLLGSIARAAELLVERDRP